MNYQRYTPTMQGIAHMNSGTGWYCPGCCAYHAPHMLTCHGGSPYIAYQNNPFAAQVNPFAAQEKSDEAGGFPRLGLQQ